MSDSKDSSSASPVIRKRPGRRRRGKVISSGSSSSSASPVIRKRPGRRRRGKVISSGSSSSSASPVIRKRPGRRRRGKVISSGSGSPSDAKDRVLVQSGESDSDILSSDQAESEEPEGQRDFRRVSWNPARKPGQKGFNRYIQYQMQRAGVFASNWKIGCDRVGGEFVQNAYQKTVDFCIHPTTPINRFLVLDRAGSGKSWILATILENYFYDPRPKIVIVPNDSVKRSIFQEILRRDSLLRDYIRRQLGDNDPSWQDAAKILTESRNNLPGGPFAVLKYTIAGGTTVLGKRTTARFPFGANWNGRNQYDDKIILMDEFHNLLFPSKDVEKYSKKLKNLAKSLRRARNSVVVGFTATPIVTDPGDADKLIAEIKGDEYRAVAANDGFISYFQELPDTIYPSIVPNNPDIQLPFAFFVKMVGHNAAAYVKKVRTLKANNYMRRQNYSNMSQYYATGHTAFQKLLDTEPYSYATKLAAIAKSVSKNTRKTLILCHRTTGQWALEFLCKKFMADATKVASLYKEAKGAGQERDIYQRFNSEDNNQGEDIQVLIANSQFYSEGVDFFTVRRMIVVDVPTSFAQYEQQVGRVLRACAYQNRLDRARQKVQLEFFIARDPRPGRNSVDEDLFVALQKQQKKVIEKLRSIRDVAVDYRPLRKLIGAKYERLRVLKPIAKSIRIPDVKPVPLPGEKKPNQLSVAQLKKICKQKGIKGYSRWKRDTLIAKCAPSTSRKRKPKQVSEAAFNNDFEDADDDNRSPSGDPDSGNPFESKRKKRKRKERARNRKNPYFLHEADDEVLTSGSRSSNKASVILASIDRKVRAAPELVFGELSGKAKKDAIREYRQAFRQAVVAAQRDLKRSAEKKELETLYADKYHNMIKNRYAKAKKRSSSRA